MHAQFVGHGGRHWARTFRWPLPHGLQSITFGDCFNQTLDNAILPSTCTMDFLWIEFHNGASVKSVSEIRLGSQAEGAGIRFHKRDVHGSWLYFDARRLMMIEFVCSNKRGVPLRRHCLIPNDDDQTFELLPMNDEVYTSDDIPWSKGSVPHYNRDKIVMQILKKPSIHRLSNKFAEDLFETHCEDRLELQSR